MSRAKRTETERLNAHTPCVDASSRRIVQGPFGRTALRHTASQNQIGPYAGKRGHTDAEREWAYGRDSHIGKLDKALGEADKGGWTVVNMKDDWKVIYPPAGQ